jgi:hypothetical protein
VATTQRGEYSIFNAHRAGDYGASKGRSPFPKDRVPLGNVPTRRLRRYASSTMRKVSHQDESKTESEATRSSHRSAARITPYEYGGIQATFDHFNAELLGGELIDIFITYQRRVNSRGYFRPIVSAGAQVSTGDMSLRRTPTLSLIVRRSGSVRRWCRGKWTCGSTFTASRLARVSRQAMGGKNEIRWGAAIVDGCARRQGNRRDMSHYLVPDGPFARAFAELAATGWGLQWQSAHRPGASGRGNASKTKCTRTACKQNAWGRSDLAIMCKPCRLDMVDVSHVSVSYDQQPGGVGGRYG